MKNWNRPEMKIFNVKMDENIASSGADGGNNYEVHYIYYSRDDVGTTLGGANYRCTADRSIQDTNIKYEEEYGDTWISEDLVSQISGCLD